MSAPYVNTRGQIALALSQADGHSVAIADTPLSRIRNALQILTLAESQSGADEARSRHQVIMLSREQYDGVVEQLAIAAGQIRLADVDTFPPPVSIDMTTPIPAIAPTVCRECTEEFDDAKLLRRKAEGFDFCLGCMIELEKDGELSKDDQADLAEQYWTDRERRAM